jgi:hypothetical protein
MEEAIRDVASQLGYKKIERIIGLAKESGQDVFDHILRNSIKDDYAILFFPATMIQISPYGIIFERAMPINKASNFLTMHPELTEKFLRTIFTGFELILYKVCHIVIEQQRADYEWESEKSRTRFRKVIGLLKLDNEDRYKKLFDELFFVRDAFAHSFVEIDKIKYKYVPLSECFGHSFIGYSRCNADDIFVDDMNELFEPLMELFKRYQLAQIDASKFAKICNGLVNQRSLAPGR